MDSEEEAFDKIINAIPSMGETGATIDELSKITRLERHTLSKNVSKTCLVWKLSEELYTKAISC